MVLKSIKIQWTWAIVDRYLKTTNLCICYVDGDIALSLDRPLNIFIHSCPSPCRWIWRTVSAFQIIFSCHEYVNFIVANRSLIGFCTNGLWMLVIPLLICSRNLILSFRTVKPVSHTRHISENRSPKTGLNLTRKKSPNLFSFIPKARDRTEDPLSQTQTPNRT